MDLQEIRGKLDVIDRELLRLFEERMRLCGDVAEFKMETGKPVFDKERERQKLESVRSMAHGEFNGQAASELFSQMMTISRRYQYRLMAERGAIEPPEFERVAEIKRDGVRVVFQGVEGAYSHLATLQYFGEGADAYHVADWEDAMRDVESGKADYAVLPIENSSAGAVSDNYDLLVKYHNYIVAETYVAVNHALLGLPEAELSDIRTVISHPQALMQSSEYLNSHRRWQQISMKNTAVAARKVLEDGDASQAAVASETAGRLYGLKVLKAGINHNKANTTRFIILAKKPIYREAADKISLCFEGPHISGSLYNLLGNFIFNNINMLMIESRPIPGRNWEYRFFVDIEGNLSRPEVINALGGIKNEAVSLRILGNY